MERRVRASMLTLSLALLVILGAGGMALAQTSLEERVQRLEESAKMDESKNMEALWRNGLRLRTLNKDVEIRIGGRIQNDWNFMRPSDEIESSGLWPEEEPQDRVFFRRSRVYIRGTLHQHIRFKAEYDFAGGSVSWTDVYLRFVKLPAVGNLYLGKFKAPFGLEELTSSRFITFQERSLTDGFVPGRETGILLKNSVMDKRLHWALAITRPDDNGTAEGSDHNFTLRLAGTPFQASQTQLAHVGFAYAVLREQEGWRIRSRPEGRTAGLRLVSSDKMDVSGVNQFGLEGALVYGPASVQAEFMSATGDVTDGGGDPTYTAYYVMASYFLTGESRPYSGGAFGRPKPKNKFDLKKGAMGAFEVAARLSWIDLSDSSATDDNGVVTTGGEEQNFTLGLNWYPHNNARVTLNYVLATLDRVYKDANLDGETTSIVSMRFQVDF